MPGVKGLARFFRGGSSNSPRRKEKKIRKGGSWDAPRVPQILTGARPANLAVTPPKPPDRAIEPAGPVDASVWWSADERQEQLARTQWVVAVETQRRARDEPRPPIPGESRRGLGVACEPSTPLLRAECIAEHRLKVIEASWRTSPADVALFAAELSAGAVAVARANGESDRLAVAAGAAADEEPPTPTRGGVAAALARDTSAPQLEPALPHMLRRGSVPGLDDSTTPRATCSGLDDSLIVARRAPSVLDSMDATSYAHRGSPPRR